MSRSVAQSSNHHVTALITPLPLSLVALALNGQVLDNGRIPMFDHDRRMDLIVTPEGLIGTTDV